MREQYYKSLRIRKHYLVKKGVSSHQNILGLWVSGGIIDPQEGTFNIRQYSLQLNSTEGLKLSQFLSVFLSRKDLSNQDCWKEKKKQTYVAKINVIAYTHLQ